MPGQGWDREYEVTGMPNAEGGGFVLAYPAYLGFLLVERFGYDVPVLAQPTVVIWNSSALLSATETTRSLNDSQRP